MREQLDRYDKKADIHQSDAEFFNLVEKVIERNNPVELARIVILLLKFANAKLDKTKKETHPFKQRSYAKYTLPFYQRAYDLMKGNAETKDLETKIEYLNRVLA